MDPADYHTHIKSRDKTKLFTGAKACSVRTHLITGCTARLQLLGIVSLTVQEVIVNTVREVHQKLLTHAAHEA